MKKSSWKKGLALILALAMTTSFAGCEKKENDSEKKGGEYSAEANAAMAKENVYRYKELDFKLDGQDVNIVASRKDGDKLEFLLQTYDYSEGSQQKLILYTANTEGEVLNSLELKSEKIQSVNMAPYGASLDSNMIIGETEAEEEPVDGEIYPDDGEFYPDENYSYENTYFNSATLTANGIYAILNHVIEKYEDGDYTSENDFLVIGWDRNGQTKFESPIDMSQYQNENAYSYLNRIINLGNNEIGLLMSGDQNGIIRVKEDGTVSTLQQFSSDKDVFSRDPQMCERPDGTYFVSYYNDDWTKQYITTFDPATGKFGEEKEIPAQARSLGFYNFGPGTTKEIYFSSSNAIYGFNFGEEEITKIMDFINSDFSADNINTVIGIDENHFMASYYDNSSDSYGIVMSIFTYVKPEDVPDKKTMVYAGVYMNYDAKRAIINFNKNDNEYRIAIKDYSIYNTDEDYTIAYTKLNNDIIAGNIPDIIQLDDEMPVESFVAKELLADVDELIKKDAELSTLDYADNVFEAYRIDGKLYRVIPRFSVNTWIGKKSIVGDRTHWTMDEAKQAATKLTGEKNLFAMQMNRESFMYTLMSYCGSDFVDVKTGKCNFDSKNFIDLLEYAKTLPKGEDEKGMSDDEWDEYWNKYQSQYRENVTMLMECTLYDLTNMKYSVNGQMGEDVSYVGFPTESDCGSYVKPVSSFGISANSENIDGAWKFCRMFLTKDFQENKDYKYGYLNGLPVLKSVLREMADKNTQKPFWIDEETGEKYEWDDTYYINGQEIIIDQFTQAQADTLYDFVCSVKKPAYYDENVIKIVTEETDAFFAGSKSAKDAASHIQSRVQLYVNENR